MTSGGYFDPTSHLHFGEELLYIILQPLTPFELAWSTSYCFFFSFSLLKAVFEEPVLDLNPAQISSLTSLILSELSSNVEEWCLKKGTSS